MSHAIVNLSKQLDWKVQVYSRVRDNISPICSQKPEWNPASINQSCWIPEDDCLSRVSFWCCCCHHPCYGPNMAAISCHHRRTRGHKSDKLRVRHDMQARPNPSNSSLSILTHVIKVEVEFHFCLQWQKVATLWYEVIAHYLSFNLGFSLLYVQIWDLQYIFETFP